MSSLTKFIFTDRHRVQRDHKGAKAPMMMEFEVPSEFDPTCISLMSGKLHVVGVKEGRPTKTGFFNLPLEEEDKYMAKVANFLFDYASLHGWANVSKSEAITQSTLATIVEYFKAYDLGPQHVFAGMEALESLKDVVVWVDAMPTKEDAERIQLEHLHIGKIVDTPVYFNPWLKDLIVFSATPEAVGLFSRMGDFGSILIHNAERAVVMVRVVNAKLP